MAMPKSPVAINLVDVGGALALVQKPIENFRAAKPDLVSRITFTKAPAPELPGKLKAQQDAGRVDIDFVLGGLDIVSAGNEQKLWTELLPKYADILPKPEAIYLKGALDMQALGKGGAMCMVYYPSGPLIEYAPEKVKTPPGSAEELLAWAKANPNKFLYARPANSGPGRTFLMGLPYILGDTAPEGSGERMGQDLGLSEGARPIHRILPDRHRRHDEGARRRHARHHRLDHRLGHQPARARHRAEIGGGRAAQGLPLGLGRAIHGDPQGRRRTRSCRCSSSSSNGCFTPDQQAFTYDEGYFYPGPAVKDVPLSMAPAASQAAIKEFGRPQYEEMDRRRTDRDAARQ